MNSNNNIFIFTNYELKQGNEVARDASRSLTSKAVDGIAVAVDTLKDNMRRFLANIDTVIKESPKDIGGLALDEIEIYAQIDSKGKIGITGIIGGEFGAQGGIKFVLRKKV